MRPISERRGARSRPYEVSKYPSIASEPDFAPFPPPVEQAQPPQHAADVGEVGHVAAQARPPHEELHDAVDHHEPLGLDGHGQEDEDDRHVGMHDAEREQQAHDGARSAQQLHVVFARQPHGRHLNQRRTHAAYHVVDQEAPRPQLVLQRAAEHPQRKHVEKEMLEVGMQKHVGHELIGMEQRIGEPVERAGAKQRGPHGQQRRSHEDQRIDDEQVEHHRGCLEITVVHCDSGSLRPGRHLFVFGMSAR